MIRTEAGLRSTHEALLNLQFALLGLYVEKAKYGKGYPLIAEGWVAEIFKLRKEIDDMIGLTDYVAEFGVPQTDAEFDARHPTGSTAPSTNGSVADHQSTLSPAK
jgi:hypothetical protein